MPSLILIFPAKGLSGRVEIFWPAQDCPLLFLHDDHFSKLLFDNFGKLTWPFNAIIKKSIKNNDFFKDFSRDIRQLYLDKDYNVPWFDSIRLESALQLMTGNSRWDTESSPWILRIFLGCSSFSTIDEKWRRLMIPRFNSISHIPFIRWSVNRNP